MKEHGKEYVAYQGFYFTIEWFFDGKGESEALNYYKKLPAERRQKLLILFKRMGDAGRIIDRTKFRHEGDQIYAFKPQSDRFLCFFFIGKKIIVTNAFEKKSVKLPSRAKQKAQQCRIDYEQRIHRSEYYENL